MAENSSWTPERVEKLRELSKTSLSYVQIAQILTGTSSSAVRGKIFRMGFRVENKQPKQTARFVKNYNNRLPNWSQESLEAKREAEAINAQVINSGNVKTTKENAGNIYWPAPNRCKFPIGTVTDPDFRFCGDVKQIGKEYCAPHQKICYNRE